MKSMLDIYEQKGYLQGYKDAMQMYGDKTAVDYSTEFLMTEGALKFIDWLLKEEDKAHE